MAAFPTSDPRKAAMKNAAIKEPVDNMPHIWPEEPVLLGEALIIDLLQSFKVILNTPVIL